MSIAKRISAFFSGSSTPSRPSSQAPAAGASYAPEIDGEPDPGSLVDLAFYTGGADDLRLGEEFHHNGLNLRCAQINRVPRGLGFQWDRRRLANETVKLLLSRGPEIRAQLITHVVPDDDAPAFIARLVGERPEFLQIVFKVGD